jgi:hypothetical protein
MIWRNKMISSFKTTLAVAVSLVVLALSPAHAFQKGEGCQLKITSDGFVALRKGPSVSSKRIHKLNLELHRVFPDQKNKSWVRVDVVSPEEWDVPVSQQWNGSGYVKSSLIDWSTCSNAG